MVKKELSQTPIDLESLVVNGSEHTEAVDTPIGRFFIRPLTIGEQSSLKFMPWQALNANTEGADGSKPKDENLARGIIAIQGNDEQRISAIAFGLSCRKKDFSPDKVRAMIISESIVDMLFNKILEISEVSIDDLRPFSPTTKRVQTGDTNRKRASAKK